MKNRRNVVASICLVALAAFTAFLYSFIYHPKYSASLLVGSGQSIYVPGGSFDSQESSAEICPSIAGCQEAYTTEFGVYISFSSYRAAEAYYAHQPGRTLLRNVVYDYSGEGVSPQGRGYGEQILKNYEDPH